MNKMSKNKSKYQKSVAIRFKNKDGSINSRKGTVIKDSQEDEKKV